MINPNLFLAGWFGSKEWLKYFIQYLLWNAITVVFYTYLNLTIISFVLSETVGSYPSTPDFFFSSPHKMHC
jgi:hypothetical protein